ncbi:MAG: class I SAM-dependent methyltransferase [Woeseiaceae bacterium]|nr:class I SAM-dependent methyltransferase [Woeseiaceae bacterium]
MTGTREEAAPDKFAEYYREASLTDEAMARFLSIRDLVGNALDQQGRSGELLDVADIGCAAGTQSMIWAKDGHRVQGIDINETLIEIATERAKEEGLSIEYLLGTAEDLPWPDSSFDVCLVPELLEHVPNWSGCLSELARILRPGGILFLSTNNVLCPKQQEFDLPLYSWYPAPLKRHYEKLAVTTRPELVNHAKFPAVHWFSFYSLRRAFAELGMSTQDRFDAMNIDSKGALHRVLIPAIRALPPLRFLAHVFTPYTSVIATKESS